jgi:hypothetical protein
MFALKWLLVAAGVALLGSAAGVVAYDVYLSMQFHKLMGSWEPHAAKKAGPRRSLVWQAPRTARRPRGSLAEKLFGWAFALLFLAASRRRS